MLVIALTRRVEIGVALFVGALVWDWFADLWIAWQGVRDRRRRSRARWDAEEDGPG